MRPLTSVYKQWLCALIILLQCVILHQRTKFDENPPIHGVEMALWRNPNGGRLHFEFWSDGIFDHMVQFRMLFCSNVKKLNQNPQS